MGSGSRRVYGRAAAMFLAVAFGVSCTPPDAPPRLSSALSPAVIEAVRPDSVRTVRVGPDVMYRFLWSAEGPWAVHLIEASLRARCDLVLDVLQPDERAGGGSGFATVTEMVSDADEPVLVAVNADFFTPEGNTVGSEVVDGRVRAARTRPALGWRSNAPPWFGIPSVTPTELNVGWSVPREGGDGATEAVGGFPILIAAGVTQEELGVSAMTRHPRTAVGYSTDLDRLWLVVVDGRQPPLSSGMTLVELTSLFEALGADEALNLDGGGSSVMVVRDNVVSSPSDDAGERPVVNALALRREASACEVSDRR